MHEPVGAGVYLDTLFRGSIRPSGDLRIEQLPLGPKRLAVDLPDGQTLDHAVNLTTKPETVDINALSGASLLRLQTLIGHNLILGPGSAWVFFKAEKFADDQKPAAVAMMAAALENVGQDCVGDYVQSTSTALKRVMLLRSAEALDALRQLRPEDRAIEARKTFCQARAQIAAGDFSEAERSLRASLAIDPNFACSHNALGVALTKLGRTSEARVEFEKAVQLTPEWSLPYWQLATQLIAADKVKEALPYLEKAARYNPRSVTVKWTYLRAARVLDRTADVEKLANEIIALDPNYAPTYIELGQYYEERRDYAKASQAYDNYLLLAPNFADSSQVRQHVTHIRPYVKKRKGP